LGIGYPKSLLVAATSLKCHVEASRRRAFSTPDFLLRCKNHGIYDVQSFKTNGRD
jgi:hypothetical protein